MELVSNHSLGYIILHGDLAGIISNPDGVEVVVSDDGTPFKTSVEALAVAKVSCSEAWQVVAVRTADRLPRSTVVKRAS